MTERRRVSADGIELAYDVSGDAAAPPMVLLHGLGERAAGWAPASQRFAQHYRVHAFELRGHGESDHPGDYSIALMREDVCAALDALGLDEVVLVGHSMGGSVAFQVVGVRPDLVSRLVIEDAPPLYPREPRAVPERPIGPLDIDWAVVPAIIPEVNAGDPEAWATLGEIAVPTLLVGGGSTSHVDQGKLAEAAERIPDCTLVTIEAGHHVHLNAPSQFSGVVLDWLARRPA